MKTGSQFMTHLLPYIFLRNHPHRIPYDSPWRPWSDMTPHATTCSPRRCESMFLSGFGRAHLSRRRVSWQWTLCWWRELWSRARSLSSGPIWSQPGWFWQGQGSCPPGRMTEGCLWRDRKVRTGFLLPNSQTQCETFCVHFLYHPLFGLPDLSASPSAHYLMNIIMKFPNFPRPLSPQFFKIMWTWTGGIVMSGTPICLWSQSTLVLQACVLEAEVHWYLKEEYDGPGSTSMLVFAADIHWFGRGTVSQWEWKLEHAVTKPTWCSFFQLAVLVTEQAVG